MNHHILIFFWDLEFMKLRWSVRFKWNDFKIHLRSWYLSHRHCKQNLPSSNMHSTLWSLSSTYNIFEPYKPSPCFGIRYVSCHIPMISTVLEITKTRYLCHLKLTDVIWNLRMSKQDWFHQLSQMMSDLSSCLDSRYLMLIQESADSLSWSISDEPSPIEVIW